MIHLTLSDVEEYARNAHRNYAARDSVVVHASLVALKQDAVASGDQTLAKRIWCLQKVVEIQDYYFSAFRQLKSREYHQGWCSLADAELLLEFLAPHKDYLHEHFHVGIIERYVHNLQSIFPYRIFVSPEIVNIAQECSICHRPLVIRSSCGHSVGEIYDGEQCHRIITDFELKAIAVVRSPIDKKCVIFLTDPQTKQTLNHYDYTPVCYLMDRVKSPFDPWEVIFREERESHSHFPAALPARTCPCGSGHLYRECCLPEAGVLRRGMEFILADFDDEE